MENWKQIPNYENYEISDLGKVRNIKTKRILRQSQTQQGHVLVVLCKNGKTKTYSLHRLVKETFDPIENMDDMRVEHKDNDKTNNSLDNLEWTSNKELRVTRQGIKEIKRLEIGLYNTIRKTIYKIFSENDKYFKNDSYKYLTIIQTSDDTGFMRILSYYNFNDLDKIKNIDNEQLIELLAESDYCEEYSQTNFHITDADNIDNISIYETTVEDNMIKNKLIKSFSY